MLLSSEWSFSGILCPIGLDIGRLAAEIARSIVWRWPTLGGWDSYPRIKISCIIGIVSGNGALKKPTLSLAKYCDWARFKCVAAMVQWYVWAHCMFVFLVCDVFMIRALHVLFKVNTLLELVTVRYCKGSVFMVRAAPQDQATRVL